MSQAKPSLTDTLCTQCGLCCDGSLFADVELANAKEASALEVMGLDIEDDEDDRGVLLQPCRALKGKCCSIYAHRPTCCRTFECRLLQEVERGTVEIKQAQMKISETLQQIASIKKLLAQLGQRDAHLSLKERCEEALTLSENSATDPKVKSKRTELQTAMVVMETLLRKTFLDG